MSLNQIKITVICFLLLTPLRAAFILIAPVFILWIAHEYNCQFWNSKAKLMTVLFALSSLYGLLNGTTTADEVLLSFWIVYPILLLLLSDFKVSKRRFKEDFVKISTYILLAVDVVGIGHGFYIGFSDPDLMRFSYGDHFARQNGLAIINTLYFLYYMNDYVRDKSIKKALLCLFLAFSLILCECGLALVCLLISFAIWGVTKVKVKSIAVSVIIVLIGFFFIIRVSSDIGYYTNTLNYFLDRTIWDEQFRKILAFTNYAHIVEDSWLNAFFGVGPGGYNSRIAFLLNNDADNPFTKYLGHSMPYYHSYYIYPLWDQHFLDINLYNDGSRNKPFSSVLSVLSEYGVFFCTIIYGRIISICLQLRKCRIGEENFPLFISIIFILLLLLLDQWLETSEMCFFMIFLLFTLNIKRGTIKSGVTDKAYLRRIVLMLRGRNAIQNKLI